MKKNEEWMKKKISEMVENMKVCKLSLLSEQNKNGILKDEIEAKDKDIFNLWEIISK